MTAVGTLGRRAFLKVTAGTGAGLWLGLHLPSTAGAAEPEGAGLAPDAYLRVEPGGAVTVFLAKSEMGQGTFTGMAVLVAEELEADWRTVKVVQADADAKRFGQMSTGGSASVRHLFDPLRKTGATAREMLVSAAARQWQVARSECRAEEGFVVHAASGRKLSYGALASDAAKEEVPKDPPLKDPRDWRLIGKKVPRLDTPDKIRGRARFGVDVRVPKMRFAVIARPPVVGGKLARFDARKAKKVPGVRTVVAVPSGVAVVADSTWAAIRGREALAATFEPGPNGALDSAMLAKLLAEAPVEEPPARSEGNLEAALAAAAQRLEAAYEVPLLAHATMEPMNCTADVRRGSAELWAPTQAPTWAQSEVAKALMLEPEQVKVHVTFLGGGFGRRAMPDFAVEAALVSRALGEPVQVVWTREDDMRHDFYRPAGRNELRGGLDASGRIVAWHHRVRTPSIGKQLFGASGRAGGHPDVLEGAIGFPYEAGAVRVEAAMPEVGLRLGWWRSVYASQNAFPEECFLNELAAAAGKDALDFRLEHLPRTSRLRGVLELAAEKARWGDAADGHGLGIACHSSFGSHVAEIADVTVENGRVRIHRVVAAVDVGVALNPDSVAHQVEGAIAFALSAALRGEITLAKGAVVQGNFDDYLPLRMDEMPKVEVHVVSSKEPPGGIGEPGVPPLAPAVANAVFAASGKRVRKLPIRQV